jgi:hypothetical protein
MDKSEVNRVRGVDRAYTPECAQMYDNAMLTQGNCCEEMALGIGDTSCRPRPGPLATDCRI